MHGRRCLCTFGASDTSVYPRLRLVTFTRNRLRARQQMCNTIKNNTIQYFVCGDTAFVSVTLWPDIYTDTLYVKRCCEPVFDERIPITEFLLELLSLRDKTSPLCLLYVAC